VEEPRQETTNKGQGQMNQLFWLTNLVIAFTAYSLGRFITIRNLRIAADKLMAEAKEIMAKIEADNERWKAAQERMAEKIAAQALEDNATGSPIGVSLARELGVEL
jgi:uncharacterized protein YpuA (DUF1002 family)